MILNVFCVQNVLNVSLQCHFGLVTWEYTVYALMRSFYAQSLSGQPGEADNPVNRDYGLSHDKSLTCERPKCFDISENLNPACIYAFISYLCSRVSYL